VRTTIDAPPPIAARCHRGPKDGGATEGDAKAIRSKGDPLALAPRNEHAFVRIVTSALARVELMHVRSLAWITAATSIAFCLSSPAFAQSMVVPAPTGDVPRPAPIPQAAPGEQIPPRVTFDAAVKRALDRNPTAKIADEEIHRARALMEEVRSSSLPTLYGYGTYTRLDSNRVSGGVVAVPDSALNANITLNAPLIYPRGWIQWSQAGDQIDVQRANAADVRRTLAVTTARAYLTILTQKSLRETAITARDNAKAHFEYTRAQLVGGIGNRLDEMRAAQELTTDEVNVQNQEVALVRAREALGVLVAGDGAIDCADEPSQTQLPSLSDAMNESQTIRADVRARERAARASERTVKNAWADYMPYLNLIAFPFYQSPPTPTIPQTGWEAQLVLTVPLYDGGLRYGQEHERRALADEAQDNVEATLRQAKSDVRTAFEEIRRADIALDQARQSADFAKQALALANLAYHAGATSNLEVIDAERQARDAETQAAIAEDAARQARLDFLAASGRFP
jgi:outer membrane protein TolC